MLAIIYGRNMIINVKKFVEFNLTVNFSIIALIVFTTCLSKDTPFTFAQLLIINLLMDTFAATQLAYQNPRETNNKLIFDINKTDSIVNVDMWIKIIMHTVTLTIINL